MSCLPYAEGFCHGNNSLFFWHFMLLFSQAGHFHKRKKRDTERSWWTERMISIVNIAGIATAGNELMESLILFNLSRVRLFGKGKANVSCVVSLLLRSIYTYIYTRFRNNAFYFLCPSWQICGKYFSGMRIKSWRVDLWNSLITRDALHYS